MESSGNQPTDDKGESVTKIDMGDGASDDKLLVNGVERFETFLKNQKMKLF